MVKKKCSTCGTEVMKMYTAFKCPKCSKSEIVRCGSCRGLGAEYVCPECGFSGP